MSALDSAGVHEIQKCPICGTDQLRTVYGLPTAELVNDPTVKLMGCLIDCEIPEWYCPVCDETDRC